MISLYNHQQKLVDKARQALSRGVNRFVLVASTGFGKTRVACHIIESAVEKGNTVVILCNRDKLIKQWADVLSGFNIDFGIIQYGIEPNDAKVQLASIDSYVTRLDKKHDICISDEMHYALGENYRACIEYQEAKVSIGLSATPVKANGEGFKCLYDEIIESDNMEWLIKNGYLAPLHIYSASPPDLKMELVDGDFNSSQYMRLVSGTTRISDAVSKYKELINGKLTIVFSVNIADARNIAKHFNDAGISAKCIHSKQSQKTQDKILQGFKDKEYLVLTSVSILNEGVDIPWIEAGIDLSPTASLSRFLQRWGRCIRISEGKTHATMLDMCGNFWIHGEPWRQHNWSLEGRPVSKRSVEESILSVALCLQCGRSYNNLQTSCPFCGAGKQQRKRAIKTTDGTLTLVTESEAVKAEREAEERIREKEKAEAERIARAEELKQRKKVAKTLEAYEQIERDFKYEKGWAKINYRIWKSYVDKGHYRW